MTCRRNDQRPLHASWCASLIQLAEYHTLVVSKLPGAQGGVIDREGNVLFTTDPAIVSASNLYGITSHVYDERSVCDHRVDDTDVGGRQPGSIGQHRRQGR